jgi:hypothetical protein
MIRRIALLTLSALLALFTAEAQQQASQEPPKQQAPASSASQPPTFGQSLRKSVGFLTVNYLKDGVGMQSSGTCFFVFYEDKRLGEKQGFRYLVTNRHMAAPGVEKGESYTIQQSFVRLNLRNPDAGKESEETNIPLGGGMHWVFPADGSVDLAVLPVGPDQNRYDYVDVPASILATKDQISTNNMDAGDNVVFAGYFVQFPGQKKIQPVVRQGVLSVMPDELMETTLRKPGHLYLADVHTFHGNSGSPMFVNVGGLRNGHIFTGSNYLLLGVVSGYYLEDADFKLTVATTLEGTLHSNSGISIVVPAYELKAVLDSPLLQGLRDGYVKYLEYEKTKKDH